LFEGTRHKGNNTVVGWAAWAGILAVLWIMAWIIAEVIPFFSDLLSIMSSLFDSFFGFIFWGVAYIRMRAADHGPDFYKTRGLRGWCGFIFNVFLIFVGLFFLGPGTYVSIICMIYRVLIQSFPLLTLSSSTGLCHVCGPKLPVWHCRRCLHLRQQRTLIYSRRAGSVLSSRTRFFHSLLHGVSELVYLPEDGSNDLMIENK
jgi:hypothetical protein